MNKKLIPSKAIKAHCVIFCINGNSADCESKECVLKLKMSSLKKIKAFCKECAPDFNVKECDGIVLNTEETRNYGKCPLWVYRFGKNPYLKGRKAPEHLKDYYFTRNKAYV